MTLTQAQKRIDALTEQITALSDEAREIQQDMQYHFDERSEKWQEGERGGEWQEMVDMVEEWADAIQTVADEKPEVCNR